MLFILKVIKTDRLIKPCSLFLSNKPWKLKRDPYAIKFGSGRFGPCPTEAGPQGIQPGFWPFYSLKGWILKMKKKLISDFIGFLPFSQNNMRKKGVMVYLLQKAYSNGA